MADSKYFQNQKKGEIPELREELRGQTKEKKKEAVKKVIAAMTVGKDVSSLFTDVVNCMQTQDLELKKLVYLYVMNYAKSQPDLAILAVNTFVKDAADPSPLVRALAVRTMGCIRVDKITEYVCEPLRKCLQDEDAYVRKTAAVCVAKLHDINSELVADQGFLDTLRDMLSDSTPMVVANVVSALTEISETSMARDVFKITSATLTKLLAALGECTEWGQVFILDSLSYYQPTDAREAESICERVSPRLQHANSAVVISAVRIIIKYLDLITNPQTVRALSKKMAPPLITLMSSKEPEIQYVALRIIDLIVQKRPAILENEVKIFFCKYNDPIYVKLEKLEIMIKVVGEKNVELVLLEFKEYAQEVDVEFVRRSVRAIGRTAIKLEKAAPKCIEVLVELIHTKVNYVVQEAIVVIKDIFRKYPNKYESVISTLCENLDTLDEPEAKGAMVWIIGEYAERIDNANELLEYFLDSFQEESTQVQLQLLTATVKLFLKKPNENQAMVQNVLNMATNDSDNPDLRDRGYVYWRLLSTDPAAAKAVVLSKKPLINDDTNQFSQNLLDELVKNIGTLSSVYHKPPETFVSKLRAAVLKSTPNKAPTLDDDEPTAAAGGAASNGGASIGGAGGGGGGDLLDLSDIVGGGGGGSSSSAGVLGGSTARTSAPTLDDEMDFFLQPTIKKPTAASAPLPILLNANQGGNGLQIQGAFRRRNGNVFLDVAFTNMSPAPLSDFAIQFNKNAYGVAPLAALTISSPVMPGAVANAQLLCGFSAPPQASPNADIIQIAVKSSTGVVYFQAEFGFQNYLVESGEMQTQGYRSLWISIPDAEQRISTISDVVCGTEAALQKLQSNNFFLVARRSGGGEETLYISAKTAAQGSVMFELAFQGTNVRMTARSTQPVFLPACEKAVAAIIKSNY